MVFLIILLIIMLIIGDYFARISMLPKTMTHEETHKIEEEKSYLNQGVDYPFEEVFIESSYGYHLYGKWYLNESSKKTIILCHGYTYNLNGSIKYMNLFMERGFNVLIYDHRYHGKSGGNNCSMGFYEKEDLKSFTTWVKDKVGQDSIVATHGESMGGATVLMHAAIDNRVSFVVADCPFESVYEQFKYRLKIEYRLPPFPILVFSNIMTWFRIKTSYKFISPIRLVDKITCPVLFIHGQSDEYIPHEHSIHLHDKKIGDKSLYLVKGADHAESYRKSPETYKRVVHQFIDTIGIN